MLSRCMLQSRFSVCGKPCFPEYVSKTDSVFVFSSESMEERYEHKTQVHIQEMVRICAITWANVNVSIL